MTLRSYLKPAAVTALALVAVLQSRQPAQAEILLHTNNAATIPSITAPTSIIISGNTIFSFNVPGTAFVPVMITFNAECGVGGSAANRLDVDILLDAAGGTTTFNPVSPTSSTNNSAMCSGDGTASNGDSLMMGSLTVAINVPPGLNRIQVRATPTAGSIGPGRIGVRTLVVMR